MLRRALSVLVGGLSCACGFAALGVALYAQGSATAAAAALFGASGFGVGVLCAALTPWRDPPPAQRTVALSRDALASLLRATLASAASERAARPGSAADRRPAATAAEALARAATLSPAAAAALPSAAVAPPPARVVTEARHVASSVVGV